MHPRLQSEMYNEHNVGAARRRFGCRYIHTTVGEMQIADTDDNDNAVLQRRHLRTDGEKFEKCEQ